jgi:hypothetical protein
MFLVKFSKGAALNTKQFRFLQTVLKTDANPNPSKIDMMNLPVVL